MNPESYSSRGVPGGGSGPTTVVMTGARGLIGGALRRRLEAGGHRILTLVRSKDRIGDGAAYWNPEEGRLDRAALEGMAAVVHLAGEPIEGWWTEAKKRRIRGSRVNGTALLAERIAELESPPAVLVSASAVGYYGNRGVERLPEEASRGSGFLAGVCEGWEAAARRAGDGGVRVVNPRFGVVLSESGGMLKRMLPVFRMGAGGHVGDGSPYLSWITLADAVDALELLLHDSRLSGPVNLTTPNPVTQREFSHELGKVLGRPAALPIPAAAVRLALGQAAEEMILSGQRAVPEKLERAGFRFQFPRLRPALEAVLGQR